MFMVYHESMAIIRSLENSSANVRQHLSEVDATYQWVFSTEKGFLLHISTYGSDTRVSEPKVSQTIQLDERMARALAEIIRQKFAS